MIMKSDASLVGKITWEFILISDNIGMIELLHDINLLIDVFLKKGLLLNVGFANDFDSVVHISGL